MSSTDAYTREAQIKKQNSDMKHLVEDLKDFEKRKSRSNSISHHIESVLAQQENTSEVTSPKHSTATDETDDDTTTATADLVSENEESSHLSTPSSGVKVVPLLINKITEEHNNNHDTTVANSNPTRTNTNLTETTLTDSQLNLYQKLKAKNEEEEREKELQHQKEIEERLRKTRELEERMKSMLMSDDDDDDDDTTTEENQPVSSDSALMLQQKRLEEENLMKKQKEEQEEEERIRKETAEKEEQERAKKQQEEEERIKTEKQHQLQEALRLKKQQEEEEERLAKQELEEQRSKLASQLSTIVSELNESGQLKQWIKTVEESMTLVTLLKTELKQAKDLIHNQTSKRTEYNSSLNYLLEKQKDPEKFLQPYEIELMMERVKNIYPLYLPKSEVQKMDEQIKQIHETEKKKREEAQLRIEQEAAERLKKEKERQQLVILQRMIKDGNVHEISEELKRNNAIIKVLNFQNKNLGNEDVQMLADALVENTNLTELDLSFNTRIDDESLASLVKMIKNNHTLRKLYLEDTFIQNNQPIIDAVAGNFKLVDMVLSEFATDDQLDQLDHYLDRNENV